MTNIEKSTIIIGILFVILVIFISNEETKEEKKYMAACMQDHKEYECIAMLKNNTQIYPVVIPMNIGR